MAKVAVIYYSATGNVHRLAQAVEEGARKAGAEVRRRHVAELAAEESIAQNQAWAAHRDQVKDDTVAEPADLEWADAFIFGTPTRFGNVAAQLKHFLDQAGGLWIKGKLADKAVGGFTSAQNDHGGQETTLLALFNVMYHWGAIIVPTGYTDVVLYAAGGNPYGVSSTQAPGVEHLEAAKYLGRRVTGVAEKLAG